MIFGLAWPPSRGVSSKSRVSESVGDVLETITPSQLACSAAGFDSLSSVLPPFWIRCRLGELGRE